MKPPSCVDDVCFYTAYTGSLDIQSYYQLSEPNSGIKIPCTVKAPLHIYNEVS